MFILRDGHFCLNIPCTHLHLLLHHPQPLHHLLHPRSLVSSGSGSREEEEHRMMASTTVFVLEPGVTALGGTLTFLAWLGHLHSG